MEVDEAGVKVPDKCQLTMVFKNGTTIQLMIALSGVRCMGQLELAIHGQEIYVALPTIVKDSKVEWDRIVILVENIMFYSVIQPKPESLISRSPGLLVPQ